MNSTERCGRSLLSNAAVKRPARSPVINYMVAELHKHCAPGGIRTPNLLIRSQMLYPLSYERSGGRTTATEDRCYPRRHLVVQPTTTRAYAHVRSLT